jgi:hypothetical protein
LYERSDEEATVAGLMCLALVAAEVALDCALPADWTLPLAEGDMVAVLQAAGFEGAPLEEALEVAWCESGYVPAAENGEHKGLFQLNMFYDPSDGAIFRGWAGWLAERHGLAGDWRDPAYNARAAYLIYRHSGWRNWAACSAGLVGGGDG